MDKKDKVRESTTEVIDSQIKEELVPRSEPQKVTAKLTGKYIIKPTEFTWLRAQDPKHDGALIFSKAEHWLSPERDALGIIVTGMTKDQQRELELEMNLKVDELSPYSKWWGTNFKIYPRIPREGLELDLDRSAIDKLRYLYMMASSKVAKSETDAANNSMYKYVLTSKEIEARVSNKKFEVKTKAFRRFSEMSLSEQMDFLKVYETGKYRLTKSASPEFINSTVGRIVDEDPEQFLSICANPDFKNMVFLQDCLTIGAVRKSGSTYYVTGGDKIGGSFLDTISNLEKPEYNEVKVGLLAKINAVLKQT